MKSSVEWLIEQLQAPCRGIPSHIIDEAKKMHENEIEEAFYSGNQIHGNWDADPEKYYQETFK